MNDELMNWSARFSKLGIHELQHIKDIITELNIDKTKDFWNMIETLMSLKREHDRKMNLIEMALDNSISHEEREMEKNFVSTTEEEMRKLAEKMSGKP